MRRFFLPIAALFIFLFSGTVEAQILITEDMFAPQKLTIKATVLDESNGEPVSYASVYLIPKGDTTISHFTLSDTTGVATIPEVMKGTYTFVVELLGYKTYTKEQFFDYKRKDLGEIKLAVDKEALEAARISVAANSIIVKQDTIEYNASSFMVSQNANLGDLLKKMPGIEVSKDGSVKVNGQDISRITVNGRTFFFDDKKSALDNLPAKMVEKVKVIDKNSETSQFSGIEDKEKEKEMDITLKKEFEEGWFGNAKLSGGTTLVDKSKDPLIDGRGVLYNGNAMVAAYNKKTQVTTILNANNVAAGDALLMFVGSDGEEPQSMNVGLPSTYQAGVNLNTTVIKGMETDASANFVRSLSLDKQLSTRTTFVDDNYNLNTISSSENSGTSNKAKAIARIKNTRRDKFMIDLNENFTYTSGFTRSQTQSSTSDDNSVLNSSTGIRNSDSRATSLTSALSLGSKNLGKKNRSLTMTVVHSLSLTKQDDNEYSALTGKVNETKDLNYDIDNDVNTVRTNINYVEPISENWNISLGLTGVYQKNVTDKKAFDNISKTHDDYYSAFSDNKSISGTGKLLMQYKKGRNNIQFGASAQTILNEIYSKSFGVSTTTGKGEWYNNISPFLQLSFLVRSVNMRLFYQGTSYEPNRKYILPVLDISNPVYISTGNIYLVPRFSNSINMSISRNNKKTFSYLNCFMFGFYNMRDVVTASWFDDNGVRYSVPVNSQKPSFYFSPYLTYNLPLGKEQKFRISTSLSPSFSKRVSYQSTEILKGIDIDTFNYADFMNEFWGDEKGSNFYSGKSGFKESLTTSFSLSGSLSLSYKLTDFTTRASYSGGLNSTHYSLNSKADLLTRTHSFSVSEEYVTSNQWEFNTDFRYTFYKGYASGYDRPQYAWNLSISKDIKAISLSLEIVDILNTTKNSRHYVTENYIEDSYSLIMGRRFLFGIKWSFGKMNSANAQKSQRAAFDMAF